MGKTSASAVPKSLLYTQGKAHSTAEFGGQGTEKEAIGKERERWTPCIEEGLGAPRGTVWVTARKSFNEGSIELRV
jgi:hypothetical protein